MTGYSKVILLGNLTRDPEVRYTPGGTAVANFSVAVNRRFRQGEENREEVCYVDVVVFGKQADSCGQYLNKGDGVLIDGRLQQRRWETEEGQKRNKLEVVAQSVQFMPKRQGTGVAPNGTGSERSEPLDRMEPSGGMETEEEVPF